MRLVLLGAPGSGKGTQGARLAEATGAEYISTGDLLRAEVEAGTDLGRTVDGYLSSGALVPDPVILDLMRAILPRVGAGRGYILDGFPRSVVQAEAVDELVTGTGAEIEHVIHLQAPTGALVSRLLARAAEEGRPDDTREIIETRLQVYAVETSPLVEFYRAQHKLTVVDADRSPDEVAAAVARVVGGTEG